MQQTTHLMLKTTLIAILFIYSIPLWRLRYHWRSTVYRMTSWKVNFLPRFGKDIAALFSNRYFVTAAEREMARRFRVYLAVYLGLVTLIICLP